MATLREKRPGVWEVRVFTGTAPSGRPTQLSKSIHGGQRDALRLAAEMEVGPGGSSSAGRSVSDMLDAWVEQNLATWAPSSARDQQSRVKGIKSDQIATLPVARLSIGDVERWHTRTRRNGMRDAGIKNQHGVLRAALSQAVRWGWVSTNVASLARLRSTKTQRRTVMTLEEVRAVIAAAASIDPAAALMRWWTRPDSSRRRSWPSSWGRCSRVRLQCPERARPVPMLRRADERSELNELAPSRTCGSTARLDDSRTEADAPALSTVGRTVPDSPPPPATTLRVRSRQ